MADFGDDEWHNMVCVEPGLVSGLHLRNFVAEILFERIYLEIIVY